MSPHPPTPSPGTGTPDEALLRAFVRGDAASFAVLAERHERSLLGLALGLLGGQRDLAADAVQESWVRVLKYARSFTGRSSVKTWLYRIVINRCHDLRAPQHRSTQATAPGRVGSKPVDGSSPDTPESFLLRSESHRALDRALAGLPDDARLILLLTHHRGLTHDEAAAVLEIPVGTVKSRSHAALERLRSALSQANEPLMAEHAQQQAPTLRTSQSRA